MNSQKNIYTTNIDELFNIIGSIYTEKDLFLRELINFSLLYPIENPDYNIKIKLNIETKELIYLDNNIGLDYDELNQYLNTINSKNIGLFSSFNICDKFSIITKKTNNPQLKFETNYKDEYLIGPYNGEYNIDMENGTSIILNINDEKYLDMHYIKYLIKKYCDYVDIPIYLWYQKTIIDEIELEYEEYSEEYMKENYYQEEENDYELRIDVNRKMDWEKINFQDKIWLKEDIENNSKYEYQKLYINLTQNIDNYLDVFPFNIDGINGIFYIPRNCNLLNIMEENINISNIPSNINIYNNNHLLIIEESPNIIPEWLYFIYGIIELENPKLDITGKVIINITEIYSKIVDLLIRFLNQVVTNKDMSDIFYQKYHHYLKMGICYQDKYSSQLYPLLKFKNNLNKEFLSISDFIIDDNTIYYLIGDNYDTMLLLPYLEKYNLEKKLVMLLDIKIDVFLIPYLQEQYHMINCIYLNSQENISYQYQPLIKVFNDKLLHQTITEIIVSNRFSKSIGSIYNDKDTNEYILELNSSHQIIENLNTMIINNLGCNLESIIFYIYHLIIIQSNQFSLLQNDMTTIISHNENILTILLNTNTIHIDKPNDELEENQDENEDLYDDNILDT